MPYGAELHGATIADYAPLSLRCTGTGEGHAHYVVQPASGGRQVTVFPVERTDGGTGTSWYRSGNPFYFSTEAAGAQYISDRHEGITRIQKGDVVERWRGSERLDDALA